MARKRKTGISLWVRSLDFSFPSKFIVKRTHQFLRKDIMSDFIIPEHIWTNKQYSTRQKLIIGVVYQHRPEPVLLDDICEETGLNKQVVSSGAMWAFLKGPNPDIERCYLPNTERKTFLVAYKYTGDVK